MHRSSLLIPRRVRGVRVAQSIESTRWVSKWWCRSHYPGSSTILKLSWLCSPSCLIQTWIIFLVRHWCVKAGSPCILLGRIRYIDILLSDAL